MPNEKSPPPTEGGKAKLINLTNYPVVLNTGEVFPATGKAATAHGFKHKEVKRDDLPGGKAYIASPVIRHLPPPQQGTVYVVSTPVLSAALAQGRTDCVAPATQHDQTKRHRLSGDIKSVPGFVVGIEAAE